MAELDWKREFEALGAKGVRAALIARRWDGDKLSAAREWLERADAGEWQATRRGGEEGTAAASSLGALRRYRWVYYIGGAAFGLLGLAQMFRH